MAPLKQLPVNVVIDQLFTNQSCCIATATAESGGGAYRISTSPPLLVFPKGRHFVRVGFGVTSCLAIDSTGQVWLQENDDNMARPFDMSFAKQGAGGENVWPVDVSAGNGQQAILLSDGRLFMWGAND